MVLEACIFYTHDSTEISKVDICAMESFCLSSSAQFLPLDVTRPRDSYAWNNRELATLLTLSERLAEGVFEPLTI